MDSRSVIVRTFVDVIEPDEEIGPDSDFFDVGGDSILAGRVIVRLRRSLGIKLSMRDLFNARTAAALAAVVDGRTGSR